jgi:hypothetical protein
VTARITEPRDEDSRYRAKLARLTPLDALVILTIGETLFYDTLRLLQTYPSFTFLPYANYMMIYVSLLEQREAGI